MQTEQRMTGGQALAEMLQRHGVNLIFGMGGFQLLPYYDAVRKQGLTHHLINDERSGIFAADAGARLTSRPGVCDATLGPGATNLVTGLVEALNAGTPLVALVGDTERGSSGRNMTQEANQTAILRPAAKDLIRIERIERIPELMRRAFSVATAGRPGPVVLDVPEDVAHGEHTFGPEEFWIDPTTTRIPSRPVRASADDVVRAATILDVARRPLILAGGGVHLSGATTALCTFAEDHGIPVAYTLSGKGAIADSSDLCAGLFGRYSRIANELIENSDCLLVIGCKLGEIATRRYELPRRGIPLIQVDIVAEELGRWTAVDVALCADARSALEDLGAAMDRKRRAQRADYVEEVRLSREKWQESTTAIRRSDETPVTMGRLLAELNAVNSDNAVVVADGGFAAHWAGLLYDVRTPGRSFVSDRGFASIGYGLPGSIGAALAAPERPVVGLTGDGGMNMSIGDLETARRTGAVFTLIVVNNAASGYVKALQHAMYGEAHYQSSDLVEMDYATIARAFGCHGIRVDQPSELKPALLEAFEHDDLPTIVDVRVTRDPGRMLPGVDNRTRP